MEEKRGLNSWFSLFISWSQISSVLLAITGAWVTSQAPWTPSTCRTMLAGSLSFQRFRKCLVFFFSVYHCFSFKRKRRSECILQIKVARGSTWVWPPDPASCTLGGALCIYPSRVPFSPFLDNVLRVERIKNWFNPNHTTHLQFLLGYKWKRSVFIKHIRQLQNIFTRCSYK